MKSAKSGFWDIFKSEKRIEEDRKNKSVEQAKGKQQQKEEPAPKKERKRNHPSRKKIRDALSSKSEK